VPNPYDRQNETVWLARSLATAKLASIGGGASGLTLGRIRRFGQLIDWMLFIDNGNESTFFNRRVCKRHCLPDCETVAFDLYDVPLQSLLPPSTMSNAPNAPSLQLPRIEDELGLLADLVQLPGSHLIELGCGAARMAAALVARYPGAQVTCLEVDERQLAKNLAAPVVPGLQFVNAGAQAIPFPSGSFDGALMLKSLHHVPMPLMAQALSEVARVLKPGGWLYVSEPVFAGPLNEIMRLFNDEAVVRAAAQQALDRSVHAGEWQSDDEHRFEMPVSFADFDTFEQRMMRPTYANHQIDETLREVIRVKFNSHLGPHGVELTRPMHVRLLRRAA
jgi:ubiquinone/menaquinone biosynthesis C-methylase UbiE